MTAQPDDDYCHRTDGACSGRACWTCRGDTFTTITAPDEPEDDECPDCLPRSQCLACADDDDRFHRELDERCERR